MLLISKFDTFTLIEFNTYKEPYVETQKEYTFRSNCRGVSITCMFNNFDLSFQNILKMIVTEI